MRKYAEVQPIIPPPFAHSLSHGRGALRRLEGRLTYDDDIAPFRLHVHGVEVSDGMRDRRPPSRTQQVQSTRHEAQFTRFQGCASYLSQGSLSIRQGPSLHVSHPCLPCLTPSSCRGPSGPELLCFIINETLYKSNQEHLPPTADPISAL